MLRPRIMQLHRYIDHDWQVTPINSQVTRSKVKVTVPNNRWNRILKTFANSLDPDETPQSVASHQDRNFSEKLWEQSVM
ncbi:hypothetical protein DPMN_029987 [Dreissena polymorpha]|uniref:Uncharacterized protein n=1 Tax=Dreissena polymorpha TaxID=45954 RepID=A0A9D4RFY8_DREPO|nr:hypothetical protein DPMN_029987 [Dreissena polymorpha]